MSAVNMIDVRVELGGECVLGPLNLVVEEGEHVLVVGRSGSGKTTLLRTLAGLQVPSAGFVALFGKPASEGASLRLAPQEREVGFLFQGGALWPHMSVEKTLNFVLARKGVNGAERSGRVKELVELVELGGLEERRPGMLSGGEAQRLALARSLAMNPRLLLLDEPLGPLDAELRGDLLAKLQRVHQDLGLTTIHVTHDPREARSIASRVLTVADGRIVENQKETTEAV